MSRTLKAGLVATAALAAGACAATTFNSTWRAPDAKPVNMQGQKVVALVMSTDQSVRFGAEDALAREITARGAIGVAAYSLIPPELNKDKEKAKEFVDKAGAKGVIAMRVVGKDKEISSTPGGYYGSPYYSSFWAGGGYYGYAWGGVYSPSYIQTDTIVSVETLAYDLTQDKLIWAGQSQTTNPSKVGPFIKELAAKVAAEMKKEGLIGQK
jgi:hypothetical protein